MIGVTFLCECVALFIVGEVSRCLQTPPQRGAAHWAAGDGPPLGGLAPPALTSLVPQTALAAPQLPVAAGVPPPVNPPSCYYPTRSTYPPHYFHSGPYERSRASSMGHASTYDTVLPRCMVVGSRRSPSTFFLWRSALWPRSQSRLHILRTHMARWLCIFA